MSEMAYTVVMPIPPELRDLLEALPEPRILTDTEYRILAANRAYREAFGHVDGTAIRLLGRTCYEISHHFDRPCDQCGESCPRLAALKTGEPSRVLHLHHTPRGEEHVDVELIPLRDTEGRIRYFMETLTLLGEKGERPGALGMVGRSAAFNAMLD